MASMPANISFGESLSDFSLSFYNQIEKTDNVCLSPFSVAAALMVLILGTDGQSRKQLETVMFKDKMPNDNIFHQYKDMCRNMQDKAKNKTEVHLAVANQLFVGMWQVERIKMKFRREARRDFGFHVGLMDFGDEPYTRKVINRWIEHMTGRKIKNLIPDGVLNDMTFMVLLNVIYFKGQWEMKFDQNKTKEGDFWINSNATVKTQMMYQKSKFKFGKSDELNCKLVELPYKGGNFSMVVILPNDKEGLPALERNLTLSTFNRLYNGMMLQDTEVTLPKFKVKSNFDIKSILCKLGVKDIFDATKANFTHMVSPHRQYGFLYVSDAIHESVIEVNEEGSETAAAIGFVITFRSAIAPVFKFTADHPFLYIIREKESGVILFVGRYGNPANNVSPSMRNVSRYESIVKERVEHYDSFVQYHGNSSSSSKEKEDNDSESRIKKATSDLPTDVFNATISGNSSDVKDD